MTELHIDVDTMVDFLVHLLNTPSPTGCTVEAVQYAWDVFESMGLPGLTAAQTRKGALLITLPGAAHESPRALSAHLDTLGLMVKQIKGSGRLKTTNLGGVLWGGIESEGVTVRTHDNRRYRGTVAPANTSVHVNRGIHTADRDADLMEIRLDERVSSAEEVRELGIAVGDYVFIDPRVEVTGSGFIRSRFLDDKAGVAAIFGALMALKQAGLQPAQDTYILLSTYEEVGHGGAADLPPSLAEFVVIDMAALGEGQESDEFHTTICVKDSSGPYHFDLTNRLRGLAETFAIPYKVDIYPYYGSDGSAYWRAGGPAQVALIGPGVDASHAYERTHRDALEHTAHLIARYLLDAG